MDGSEEKGRPTRSLRPLNESEGNRDVYKLILALARMNIRVRTML